MDLPGIYILYIQNGGIGLGVSEPSTVLWRDFRYTPKVQSYLASFQAPPRGMRDTLVKLNSLAPCKMDAWETTGNHFGMVCF